VCTARLGDCFGVTPLNGLLKRCLGIGQLPPDLNPL
jgi:hypothetical protein